MLVAAAILSVALIGLAYLVTWVRIRACAAPDPPDAADLIVILGARAHPTRPSAELGARLGHAAERWRAGVAPRIVCSGGWDGEICEPLVMARALVGLGVPARSVEIDERGHNTSATIATVVDFARSGPNHVVLVSSPYHLRRLQIEAKRSGLKPASVSAPASTPITRNRMARTRQEAREAVAIWRATLPFSGRGEPSARPAVPSTMPQRTGAQAWRS